MYQKIFWHKLSLGFELIIYFASYYIRFILLYDQLVVFRTRQSIVHLSHV